MKQSRSLWRHWRAIWRDTFLLVRDFRVPLLLFALLIGGGGLLYHALAQLAGEPLHGRVQAIYTVLSMVFLQANNAFPNTWYLQVFYFAVPVMGIGILAQGLADFGVLFFNRKSRSKEWEMAVASTFSNHIVLIGLGHLGFRVAEKLHELNQDVVVIEANPRDNLVASAQAMNIPVVQGEGTREDILSAATVQRARCVILCTQNDNLNLQMAIKARSMNPKIQVIMRIFDDDFAAALQKQFGFTALSATSMAAPAFAATAAGMDISNPITVEGQSFSLARLNVSTKSKLANLSVNAVEQTYNVSVVLLRHDGAQEFHPPSAKRLAVNDVVAVLGAADQISRLAQDNR
ncbi:MAG TPA: NAD-binding protein [Anaerolineae bacterium]